MNTVFGTLLTLVTLAGVAYSLSCYECTSRPRNEDCLAPKPCNSTSTFCKTAVTTTTSGMSISKTCAETCSPAAAPNMVSCCSENLCNPSGASGVTVSATLLSVAVGVSVLLLRAGL